MSPPANAGAIAKVLAEIDADPGVIATRPQQESFLKSLTSKYKLRYYSSTYGHTCHDEKSLRSVLIAIMRHHGKAGEDIRPGKTAVDELLERGSEMLEDDYLEAIKEAAQKVNVEEESNASDSDEESETDQELIDFVEAQSESDDDYTPYMARRTRSANTRRRLDVTPHRLIQDTKASLIDSWIEGCSSSAPGDPTMLRGEQKTSTIDLNSTTSTISVAVGGQKRRSSTTVCSGPCKLKRKSAGTPNPMTTAHKKARPCEAAKPQPAIQGPGYQNRDRMSDGFESTQAAHESVKTDGLLSIKLLAIAAIAALL